jgi:hypothetical protein
MELPFGMSVNKSSEALRKSRGVLRSQVRRKSDCRSGFERRFQYAFSKVPGIDRDAGIASGIFSGAGCD